MASPEIEYEVGQIWRSRYHKRDPNSMFVIEKIERYGDLYPNHSKPDELRITGYQVDYQECKPRTMHASSLRNMYPYPTFIPEDPYLYLEHEDK